MSQFSRVLDSQGNEIAVFRVFEQNIPFRKEDVPPHMKQAVIASEDRNFYSHNGVDIRGSARALLRDVQGGGVTQGGSTITQQYVKNTYTGKQRTVFRKVQEAIIAAQLDRQVDKEEILYRYLSTIYLGEGAFGIGAAAKSYFRKDVNQLTVSEAATLAGIIPAPSRYSPRDHIDSAESKRVLILERMRDFGALDEAGFQAAAASKLVKGTGPIDPTKGTVVYPVEQVQTQYPYFVDYVRRYLIDKYGEDTVYRGGLTIQTTLDPDLQAKADKAAKAAINGVKPLTGPNGEPNPLFASLVAVEPGSGYVKALVGGRDFAAQQVNLALGELSRSADRSRGEVVDKGRGGVLGPRGAGRGRRHRPAAGFVVQGVHARRRVRKGHHADEGVLRRVAVPRARTARGDKCLIHNAGDNEGGGSMTLAAATAGSVNAVFARLAVDIGAESIADMAKKLGVDSAWFSPRVQGVSYTLGRAGGVAACRWPPPIQCSPTEACATRRPRCSRWSTAWATSSRTT